MSTLPADLEPHDAFCIVARQYEWFDFGGRPRWRTVHIACRASAVEAYEARGYVVVFREPVRDCEPFNPPRRP
jgi:hypothetical protein